MKKQVESEKVTTVQKTVTVCDKCGLEATDPKPLYRDVRTKLHDNSFGERVLEYDLHWARDATRHEMRVYTTRVKVRPGESIIEEMRDNKPDVELCSDCYDEILSWGTE